MPESTVLVIDDDMVIRTLLQGSLTKRGFNVLCAPNGREGLELAKTESVDIIMLDWMMPEMDGMQVLRELKRDSRTMHIPVFMLTCKEDPKDIDLAVKKGAIDYIVKPFNTYEVPEMVQKYLEAHSGKKQGFFSKMFSR